MRRVRAAFLVACLSGLAMLGTAFAQTEITAPSEMKARPGAAGADTPCGMPAQLPLASQVKDPVWAVLIGVSESNLCGVLTRARLELEVKRSGRSTQIPMPYLHALRRMPNTGQGSRANVNLMFTEDLNLPVPYQVLGYHPGRMRMSGDLRFKEWTLGRVEVPNPDGPSTVLEDVRVWGLEKGHIQLDVDGWLDAMLGPKLDDMDLEGFALCRYNGERMGLALGFGPKGAGRSGAFNFREDKILFPSPAEVKRTGAYLRARLERLMPHLATLRNSAS